MNNFTVFRNFRLEAGYRPTEAAKLLEISIGHLFSIENGYRKPGKSLMLKMSQLYNVRLEDIFFAS